MGIGELLRIVAQPCPPSWPSPARGGPGRDQGKVCGCRLPIRSSHVRCSCGIDCVFPCWRYLRTDFKRLHHPLTIVIKRSSERLSNSRLRPVRPIHDPMPCSSKQSRVSSRSRNSTNGDFGHVWSGGCLSRNGRTARGRFDAICRIVTGRRRAKNQRRRAQGIRKKVCPRPRVFQHPARRERRLAPRRDDGVLGRRNKCARESPFTTDRHVLKGPGAGLLHGRLLTGNPGLSLALSEPSSAQGHRAPCWRRAPALVMTPRSHRAT